MIERIHTTLYGDIHYFVNILDEKEDTLVFLPGLTADHNLFEKQIAYFEGKCNVFTWDAPAHGLSRPFRLVYSFADKAVWLKEIFEKENIEKPIIVGQSMGGYNAQMFSELYPKELKGFISIDSAPMQKKLVSNMDILFMKHTEPVYRMFSWNFLLKAGSKGVATTEYGQKNMYEMMLAYNDNPDEYYKLISYEYRLLAEAIEKDLPYELNCKSLLICGKKDQAGYTRKYNKKWHEATGIPIRWIENAGHNSNADKPEEINHIIEEFTFGDKR